MKNTHKIVLELASHIQPVISNPLEISSQELALNLQILVKAKGPLNSQDAESYRELILGLNEKLKVLQIQYEQLEYYRRMTENLIKQKESAEQSQKSIFEQMEKLRKAQEGQISALSKEKKVLIEELGDTKNKLENAKLCEEEKGIEIESLKNQLELSKEANENLKKGLGMGNSDGTDSFDSAFKALKDSLKESLSKYDDLQKTLQSELDEVHSENDKLRGALDGQDSIISSLKAVQNTLQNENSSLKSDLARQENDLKALAELESQNQSLKSYSDTLKSQSDHYNSTIKTLTADNRNLASDLNNTKEKTNTQLQSMNSKLLQQDSNLKLLMNRAKDLENDLSGQQTQNSLLSKRLASSNQSMKTAYDELSRYQNELFEKQQKTESELEFIANYTLKTSQDHLDQERKLKKLGDIINEKDSELSILREMIGELQRPKPSYFPVKDDAVDQALAEFLNTRPEPMEVNFIREDQGTYLFGSKRVFIKIENGKIISKK